MDNVFISGITGQDGIFLTSNLLKNNSDIKIYGTTRDADNLFYKKLNFYRMHYKLSPIINIFSKKLY